MNWFFFSIKCKTWNISAELWNRAKFICQNDLRTFVPESFKNLNTGLINEIYWGELLVMTTQNTFYRIYLCSYYIKRCFTTFALEMCSLNYMVSIDFTKYTNSINYLAQKLCFWTGIIFIRVYVSVCLCVCLSVCL